MTELLTMEQLASFESAQLTPEFLRELKLRVCTDAPQRRIIASFVADLADKARKLRNAEKANDTYFALGALQWVLARFEQAAASLDEVKRNDFARELQAECYLEAANCKDALKLYEKLAEKTPCVRFDLGQVASLRGLARSEEADKLLASLGKKYDGEPEYHYQVGLTHDGRGDYEAAASEYRRALELEANHGKSLFRLAYVADLRGDSEEALELYQKAAAVQPVHVNALMNLGVLYEDMGRYEDAAKCFRTVLGWNPNHARAKLFLRDSEASLTMYYDEEQEMRADRVSKVLETPVTDFELSVRARNCLERMNIRTLGDLTQVTEAELLAYKNFGETSLSEIKGMMASKGLRLGQALEKEKKAPKVRPSAPAPVPGESVKSKPVSELELSVRARKCMERLGITNIGELCDRSEAELLSCKNFGQTSLSEVKQKLANLGLKLKESN